MKHFYMRTYIRLLLIICFLLQLSFSRAQQVFTQTQYINNLMLYNPAYSLLNDHGSLSLVGRRQWIGVDGAPTSYLLTVDMPITNIKGSLGLIAVQNKYGVEDEKALNLFFAKTISLSEKVNFAVSLNGGLISHKANYSLLDSSDPQFFHDINEKITFIGVGLFLYESEKFYISASLPNFNLKSLAKGSKEEIRHIKPNFYFAAGYLLAPDALVSVKPTVLVSYASNMPLVANGSATFYFNHRIGIGMGYGTTKDASGIVSLMLGNNFLVGYIYQTTIGNSGGFKAASHEVSLCLRFGKTDRFRLL